MLQALRGFRGLPHRCELVAEAHGVRWINDSKATNVGAALAAIQGLGAERSLVVIAGGRDKGADFRALREALRRHCRLLLLIGEAAASIEAALRGSCECRQVGSLERAVDEAAREAAPGDAVLLAPACASFDQFGDYIERGERFATLVRQALRP